MKKENEVMSCFGMLISTFLLIALGVVLNGWALSNIWNWYMPSIFGLTTLTIWKSVGVSMVFQLFIGTNHIIKSDSDTKNKSYMTVFFESLVKVTLAPVLSVFFAWIVYQFAF